MSKFFSKKIFFIVLTAIIIAFFLYMILELYEIYLTLQITKAIFVPTDNAL